MSKKSVNSSPNLSELDQDYEPGTIECQIEDMEIHYKWSKHADVGALLICANPECSKSFIKKVHTQCFCSKECRDKFWEKHKAYYGCKKSIQV